MDVEQQSSMEVHSILRLSVIAEADPGALMRVVERFQGLNIIPRRVIAEHGTDQLIRIQVDIAGLAESHLTLIAAKISQVPFVLNAYWYPI
jgi:hypothetical protein